MANKYSEHVHYNHHHSHDKNEMQAVLDQFDPLSVSERQQHSELADDRTNEKTTTANKQADDQTNTNSGFNDSHTQSMNEKIEPSTDAHSESDQQQPSDDHGHHHHRHGQQEEEQDKPFDFQRFLSQLRHKRADPIARYLKSFLSEFNKKTWTTAEQVKIIGDFRAFIANKMELCPPFSRLSENEFENAVEGMEKLVMNRLYSKTFSPEIPANNRADDHEEDVLRDRVLEEKMSIWHWIEGRHLDLADRFLRNGEAFVKLASDELVKITHYRAPRDKVICILNCCKVIFGLLRQTDSEESADGFLPILIYVVIKAQPKDLISNVNYIQRFRNPDRLGGEAGYYLSSLIGAISFIETLDRSQLSISDEEFERNVEQSVKSIAEPPPSPMPSVPPKPQTSLQDNPPETPERNSSPSLNPSSVLYNSAGIFTAPLKSLTKFFEETGSDSDQTESASDDTSAPVEQQPRDQMSPQELAARQVSAEEHEAQRIHQQEFESVSDTLSQMFPTLDREVIQDVLREKESRVGAAVDACLALVS